MEIGVIFLGDFLMALAEIMLEMAWLNFDRIGECSAHEMIC